MRCFKACFMCSSPSEKPGRAPPLPLVGATASKDKIDGPSETLELLLSKYSDQEFDGNPINPTPESKEKKVEEEEEEVRCTTRMKKKVTFELPAVYKAPKGVTPTASDVESGAGTRIDLRKTAEKAEECENLSSESGFQDKGLLVVQDDSSESLFSLSIDSTKHAYAAEVDDEKEVTSSQRNEFNAAGHIPSALDKSNSNVDLICPLIRIENMPQIRSVKARSKLPYDKDDKENIEEHQQVAVDASLSSWLVIKSETTPSSPPGPSSSLFGDRPILGSAATEEKKMQCSYGSNSRRQSPSREMPLLGTVGTYWTHTGRIIVD